VTDRGSGFVRRWRLDGLAALACVGATAAGVAVASHGVSALEERAFRLVNNLPDALERPMWAGQLLGVLFVPLGLAAVAALRRRWRLAVALTLPSGHAIVAMGIWWLVAPYLSRRWQWAALAACLMVPVARVYLGAHNPLDVLVGGAVGIAIAATLNLVLGVPRRRRSAGERVPP
jgi:membrane-associated phospholipid phosphatase